VQTVHNPDRYMADLRQVLSQGRKRIGLLVGAGAPLAIRMGIDGKLNPAGKPLIPGVDELTATVLAALSGTEATAAAAVASELGNSPNIESILSRIRLRQQAIGAFEINGLDSAGYKALANSICENIGKTVGAPLPTERNAYNELISWIGGTLRSHAIEIFTTNYDLLFEEAFERAKSPYFDGFSGGSLPFFDPVTVAGDDLPPRWSRLWKLHGSLGWKLDGNAVIRCGGREATQLVFPDYLKYDLTQKQPYSALFERLKSFMLTPDTLLLAIGFSFRDSHISAILDETLAMNANAAAFAFQYGSLAEEPCASKLAFDRPNLSVYASDGAVISGVPGLWVPGELAKNWGEIRASFWGMRAPGEVPLFLLGDFALFARFCALAQSPDLAHTVAPAAVADPAALPEAPQQ